MKSVLQDTVVNYAKHHKIDPDLVKAIIQVESAWRPFVVRFEPAWKYLWFPRECAEKIFITAETEMELQKFSWGLMQIMGSVAREHGYTQILTQLVVPEVNLEYGCRHIRKFVEKYGDSNETDIIAAYNAGQAKKEPSGMYYNQRYVDKVMQELRKIRQIKV